MKSETLVQRARRALHGLEELGRRDGVAWLCDAAFGGSDAVRALDSRGGPVVVITGGNPVARSASRAWTEWADTLGAHSSHALLFGSSAAELASEIQARGNGTVVVRCADLTDAAQTAERLAGPGATVLFSPGCTRTANATAEAESFRHLVPVSVRASIWAAA